MTKTKLVLARLVEGTKTFSDIKEALELSELEARRLVAHLQKYGYIETVPQVYQVTQRGIERHKHTPKNSPRKLAQVHKRNQAVRARRNEPAEGMVALSIKTNPNSVFSLGAMSS